MIITNFKSLNKNNLRRKALLVAEAGYEAINIKKVIKNRITIENNLLEFATTCSSKQEKTKINLTDFKNIYLIGIGKGSALASIALSKILGRRLTRGVALDIKIPDFASQAPKISFLTGTHPLPSKRNMVATAKIEAMARKAGKDDLVIAFICGGGSALACSSKDELTCSLAATKGLTAMGADILELNTVRKHASEIKGGNLAKLVYPATLVSLIVSDVLGNDLEMIASGPTVRDTTTKKDAENILKKYGINPKLFHLLETPKEEKYFKNARNILFVSNKDAIIAMEKKSKELGIKPKIYSYELKGEAKKVFQVLIKNTKQGEISLAGGETTVHLGKFDMNKGKLGKGGRNKESVLGALASFQKSKVNSRKLLFMSFASDGHDNTEAAGAIGDCLTMEKAEKGGLNFENYLANHDSFNFFKKSGDLIFASRKSFNVADLMVVLNSSEN